MPREDSFTLKSHSPLPHSLPFYYKIIDNFLPADELSKITDLHPTLTYRDLRCDLFSFLQSFELNGDSRYDFFKERLNGVFNGLIFEDKDISQCEANKNTYYTFFASIYRENDFLLCHDDMVDERLYAFTFYLKNFPSGKLILYENDCTTVHRKVDIQENRVVIFEVQPKSFHEVELCESTGRMAVSGWINLRGKLNKREDSVKAYRIDENVALFDLEVEIPRGREIVKLDFDDIPCKEIGRKVAGPFTDRRVTEVAYECLYVPEIPGCELFHTECLHFENESYILVNDKINEFPNIQIVDVFIFHSKTQITQGLIRLVDGDKEIPVDAENGEMILLRREGSLMYVPVGEKNVYAKHFMYKLNKDI